MNKWEENIRKVVPYVAGEQPKDSNIIKLNTNENPYPPSPGVYEMSRKIQVEKFCLYPDTNATELTEALAEYHGLGPDQVFVGVGSDDVLALSFLTFFNSSKPILFPDITYSFYPVWAGLYNIPFENPKVDENFCIHIEDYFKENGGVIIANPNAPTSIALSFQEIRQVIENNQDVVVIVDEAYVDFGGETALPMLHEFDNLLVVRTFSKSRSMAGMRIGYAMGNPKLIQAMRDVKESINSYTMNMESILLGAASVKDEEYFQENIRKVVATRDRVKEELRKMDFDVKESCTNFLFASPKMMSAKELFEKLKGKKIVVRYFSAPRVCDYLRITIGSDEQMDCVLDAVKECLQQ